MKTYTRQNTEMIFRVMVRILPDCMEVTENGVDRWGFPMKLIKIIKTCVSCSEEEIGDVLYWVGENVNQLASVRESYLRSEYNLNDFLDGVIGKEEFTLNV